MQNLSYNSTYKLELNYRNINNEILAYKKQYRIQNFSSTADEIMNSLINLSAAWWKTSTAANEKLILRDTKVDYIIQYTSNKSYLHQNGANNCY
jgi:hypothetical protein